MPGQSLYITAGTVALTLVNDMATKGFCGARARQNLSLAGRAADPAQRHRREDAAAMCRVYGGVAVSPPLL